MAASRSRPPRRSCIALEQHDRLRRDPFAATDRAQALTARRLDVRGVRGHIEELGHRDAHALEMGREPGRFRKDRDVGIGDPVPERTHLPHHLTDEVSAGAAAVPRIVVWEMAPDVAGADRAEERVGQGMESGVGVGMAGEPTRARDLDAGEDESLALDERVDVEALSDPEAAHAGSLRATPGPCQLHRPVRCRAAGLMIAFECLPMTNAPRPNATSIDRREPAQEPAWFLAAHFDDVLASLGDGLVVLDRAGTVVFVNPQAEDLTGVSAAQALGRTADQAFTTNPWIGKTANGLLQGDGRRTSETGELAVPFHRRVSVHLTATPILDRGGAAVGTLLLFRDLTAQRSLAEAAERGARIGDLAAVAAGLAHEIKNPLGGIKGAAQLLAEELGQNASAGRFTALITREVDRVSALLEQLLELTRPPHLRLAPVNVHRVLQEVLLLEGATASDALAVRCEFDPSLPEVWADEAQLRQVFLNLVKNALEAMGRVGTLTITTRMETDFHVRNLGRGGGKFLWIEIEDTGPGVPPEDCERIFTPFFTTKSKGTGLGLAVSQRLVTQHGGLIRVESEPGRGTRFRISLPVATGGDRA